MTTLRRMVAAWIGVVSITFFIAPAAVVAAPYAAIVVDARSGEVLHARSADRRLHPASLTKMMTLYLTFEAVRAGRLSLDQKVRVSRAAAGQIPSRIGLKAGARVSVRDLIRATAVKSANDAAYALAEAVGGTEAAFAKKMTAKARRLGMNATTFRNASGLTATGQLSTARDMARLGRALFYDFPEYYNLFGRRSTTAMGKTIASTNRRLLQNYAGADGIKTGYTNAAGYNLVSSAQRGRKRIIAVVFGGKTSASRNARVAELLDLGFSRAPEHVAIKRPRTTTTARFSPAPAPRPGGATVVAAADEPTLAARAGALIVSAAQASERPAAYSDASPRTAPAPQLRPGAEVAAAAPMARPNPSTAGSFTATTRGGWAVQLGVFARKETAIAELASAALSDVQGLDHAGREVSATTLSGASVFRARLTGFDKGEARDACDALKTRGMPCLPVAAANR